MSEVTVKNCTTCSKAIFCESLGEYKCEVRKIWIHDTDEGGYCGLYSKGTPSTYCHCELCIRKGENDDEQ